MKNKTIYTLNSSEMATGLIRAHGIDYASRMVDKMLEDNALETRTNLPVGSVFYDQVGPKDWRLRNKELDKTYNYWMSVRDILKKQKSLMKKGAKNV